METFSALLTICAENSPVNSPHKGQWRCALMFSLICARMNGWVNNREAGDLRRHQAHCDVIVKLIYWDSVKHHIIERTAHMPKHSVSSTWTFVSIYISLVPLRWRYMSVEGFHFAGDLLFIQRLNRAKTKYINKAICSESTDGQCNPHTRVSNAELSPCHYIYMLYVPIIATI